MGWQDDPVANGSWQNDPVAPPTQSSSWLPSMGEIAGGVGGALSSAGSTMADYLNPFSEARHASYAQQAQAPLGDALRQNLGQIADTGRALVAPATGPANAISEATTPFLAHPFQKVNEAAGINLPYDQAKEQAGLALAGLAPQRGAVPNPRTPAEHVTAARSVYNDPAVRGAIVDPAEAGKIVQDIKSDPTFAKFTPETQPHVFRALDRLEQMSQNPLTTIDQYDRLSEQLGSLAKQTQVKAGTAVAEPTQAAAAAMKVKAPIDSLVDRLAPGWAEADANYGVGEAARIFDKRTNIADIKAEGGGADFTQRLRAVATQMLVDPRATRGFSPEAMSELKSLSSGGTVTQKTLDFLSKVTHRFGPWGGFGAGFMHGGPIGAIIGGLGGALADTAVHGVTNAVRNASTSRHAARLVDTLLRQSPLSKSNPVMAPPPVGNISKALAASLLQRAPVPALMIPARADQN
jgi:hypothetical protein